MANAIAGSLVGVARVSDARPVVESRDSAFARLLREHGPALERLVAAYERNTQDREDLMQEIVFAIWRSLPSYRGDSSERTFVFRIGHNRAMTHVSRSSTRRSRLADDAVIATIPDPSADQASQLVAAEDRERLVDAVRRLTPLVRQTVVLSLEGLSHQEIADVLGTTAGNVAVRLTRARAVLAKLLSEGGTA